MRVGYGYVCRGVLVPTCMGTQEEDNSILFYHCIILLSQSLTEPGSKLAASKSQGTSLPPTVLNSCWYYKRVPAHSVSLMPLYAPSLAFGLTLSLHE